MTEKQNSGGMVRLTGLWKGQTKAGDVMLSGAISPSSKLIVLPNNKKSGDKDPDYLAFIAQPPERKKPEKPAINGGL